VLALSACGGGGGGGGTGSTPVQTASLSGIAAADAPKAASNVYMAGRLIGYSSVSLLDTVQGVSVAPESISAVSPVLGLVRHAYNSTDANLLTGATVSNSCTGGGTMTIDSTVRSQLTPTTGDTITITAFNCTESGTTTNGSLSVTVTGATNSSLALDSRFNNFKLASGSTADTLNGDMKFAIATTGSSDGTYAISGASLQVTEQRSGATAATMTLAPYSVTGTVNSTSLTEAANFSVSGNANGLGQYAYTVKNLQPFVSPSGILPTSGSLIVNGAASSVTATAVPNGVRVDYSANGDGVVTQTSTLSWGDFLNSF
jgi:hypothetical protein